MLDIQAALARGALARITVLREEHQTDAAQMLLDGLSEGLLGTLGYIPKTVEPFSGEAHLRERADLERIRLYGRRQTASSIAKAKDLADEVLRRVGPKATTPTLDGEARARFLSTFATALSDLGKEDAAISITEYLLRRLGLPDDPAEIVGYLAENPRTAASHRRIAIQLSNLSVRRTRLGFLAALAGDRERAAMLFERARVEAEQSEVLRGDEETVRVVDAKLLSRHNMLRADLELAASVDDQRERDRSLAAVQSALLDIVRRSYHRPTINPRSRLIRAGGLGMALVERARIAEAEGNVERAKSLAWTARLAMKATVDLWADDVDESISITIRYGEACRLTGAIDRSRRVWERSRDRLALFRGEEAPAVQWLNRRLAELAPTVQSA
jgi:hypothetical protein